MVLITTRFWKNCYVVGRRRNITYYGIKWKKSSTDELDKNDETVNYWSLKTDHLSLIDQLISRILEHFERLNPFCLYSPNRLNFWSKPEHGIIPIKNEKNLNKSNIPKKSGWCVFCNPNANIFVNISSSSSRAEFSDGGSFWMEGGRGGNSSSVGVRSSALVAEWTLAGFVATGGGTLRLSGSAAGCLTEIFTLWK